MMLWHRKGACGSEREEEREVSELYMDREREKGEAEGANGRGLP
jgi:hypothetical protein